MSADPLIEALLGAMRVSARGDAAVRDDLSPAILILAELIASVSAAAEVAITENTAPESRIEERARRLAEIENSLLDLDPRHRAKVGQQRLGVSRSMYYRDRTIAKKMRMLPP
jgi:hypothetical protein